MKGRMLFIGIMFLGGVIVSPAHATVTSDEARKVIDYYYNGKGGGAVFLSASICKEVVKEGTYKNDCGASIDPNNFPLNEEIVAWGAFLVPQDDSDTIYVEFKNMGMVWKIRELSVKGAWRYRSWTTHKLDKPGKWTISFKKLDEEKQESVVLQTFEVNVK